MSRMRGKVKYSLVEPRTKKKFDRDIVTKLDISMHNIRQTHMEEIHWDMHWNNFIAWGMEVNAWK
jgi:hypothetical protein